MPSTPTERLWTLLSYALALIAMWWAGLHNAYRLLAIFQAIDIALGILGAIGKDEEGRRKFRSNIGLAGVTRRAATWLFIFAVGALQTEAVPMLGSVTIIKDVTIAVGLAYVAAFFEFSSIVENVQGFGVKIPGWFTEILKRAEQTLGLTAEDKVKK